METYDEFENAQLRWLTCVVSHTLCYSMSDIIYGIFLLAPAWSVECWTVMPKDPGSNPGRISTVTVTHRFKRPPKKGWGRVWQKSGLGKGHATWQATNVNGRQIEPRSQLSGSVYVLTTDSDPLLTTVQFRYPIWFFCFTSGRISSTMSGRCASTEK